MNQYSQKQLQPFFLKMTIVLTVFITTYFIKNNESYILFLRTICFITLILKPTRETIKDLKQKRKCTEVFLLTVASFINVFIGNLNETIILLFLYHFLDYYKNKYNNNPQKCKVINNKGQIKEMELTKVKVGDTILLSPKQPCFLKGKLLTNKATIIKDGKEILKKSSDILEIGSYSKDKDIKVRILEKYKNSFYYEYDKVKTEWNKTNQLIELYKSYKTILTITALFLIFIPNFLTGEIQKTCIHLGVLLLVIANASSYFEVLNIRENNLISELYKKQIHIFSHEKLKNIPKIKNIIFEKTGTLTIEELRITKIEAKDSQEELWKYVYYAEYNSKHPIAEAIRAHKYIKIDEKKIKKYQEYPSRGVECKVDKDIILVGNAYFLKDKKIDFEKNMTIGTVLYVAVNKQYIGYIVLSDSIKSCNKKAITKLKEQGIKNLFTLSGDNEKIVNAVSKELGITDKYSNLTIDEKIFWTKHLKEYYKGTTAIVGNQNTSEELLNLADISIILLKDGMTSNKGDIQITSTNLEPLSEMIDIVSLYEQKRNRFNQLFLMLKILWIILALCEMLPIWLPLLLEEIFCMLEKRKENNI